METLIGQVQSIEGMQSSEKRSDAGVLDILFAVALGEGFLAGMHDYRNQLVSGEVFSFAEPGQGMYRILLSFLIIILSWLHFRSETMASKKYPRGEFAVDVIIVMTYMALFLFIDAPTIYYMAVTAIWCLYLLSGALSGQSRIRANITRLLFVAAFSLIAVSSVQWVGNTAEWTRLVLLTLGIVIYRPLDQRYWS